MNDEPVGLICVREASRQHKTCDFKRAMLIQLAKWRDIDAPPACLIGSSLMIAAQLSGNIQWEENCKEGLQPCNNLSGVSGSLRGTQNPAAMEPPESPGIFRKED